MQARLLCGHKEGAVHSDVCSDADLVEPCVTEKANIEMPRFDGTQGEETSRSRVMERAARPRRRVELCMCAPTRRDKEENKSRVVCTHSGERTAPSSLPEKRESSEARRGDGQTPDGEAHNNVTVTVLPSFPFSKQAADLRQPEVMPGPPSGVELVLE